MGKRLSLIDPPPPQAGQAFYNDTDSYCAQWLRNLAGAGYIMDGAVDERPIQELRAADVVGFERVHFFAGIGGWDYALRLAGWPVGRPVWTGSCPCQPFSNAGRRKGVNDERHLWPEWFRLIAECRPPVIFGEQVAGKSGREWLAGVRADLEALGYAVGAADLPAASVGAPHIRQRLWWVAYAERGSTKRHGQYISGPPPGSEGEVGQQRLRADIGNGGPIGGLGGSAGERLARQCLHVQQWESREDGIQAAWSRSASVHCADGKVRRLEPGIEPLVDGFPGRVGQVRAYGNAIVPQVAAQFIAAFMDVERGLRHSEHPASRGPLPLLIPIQ